MSYLPELRTSLVKAARHRYADAPAPQRPRRGPRWLSGGGLATALAASTAIAVAVVALVTLGHSPARTPAASSPAVTRVALRAAAMQALDRVALPSGAGVSALKRGIPAQLWSPSSQLTVPKRVDVYRVWRLRESPVRVIDYIEAHRAKGWSGGIEGVSGSYVNGASGRPVAIQANTTITLPVTGTGIWRQLAFDAVTLRGGGTALRVDSEAGWLRPRPAGELIPSGVTRIEVTWSLRTLRKPGSVMVTNPDRVKAIVSAFNSLPAGTGTCRRASIGLITFAFEDAAGKAPLAIATWAPPCQTLGLAIGGGPNAPLTAGSPDSAIGTQFYPILDKVFPPTRVSSSGTTLHSTKRCASSEHSTPALSPSAPGAGVSLCTSASRSTKHASVP